jgi:anti-sigma factor (TIGR02949 family)
MTLHDCRDRARMLGPYLDGELEAAKLIEIDEHVAQCETCREEAQLLRAIRGSLKRVVRTAAPQGLRDRIGTAMAAEVAREGARSDGASSGSAALEGPLVGWASWRTMVPLATAAALALMWGAVTRMDPLHGASVDKAAVFDGDELLSELVAEHSRPLPPDVTAIPDVGNKLARYVDVPVRPARFERGGAHFVGGRVMPLRSQRAAMLQYVVGTGEDAPRVSVYVYDAQKIQIDSANLAPRAVGSAEVRVGRERGYSVVVAQRAGVGYLVTSDLDPDRSAQLAAMVYEDR